MKKLLLSVFMIAALFAVVLCGCQDNKLYQGEFYTLQEAYDNGYLIQDDLKSIAYYHNGGTEYPQTVNEKVKNAIKRAVAKNLRDREISPIPNASADGIILLSFLGEYSGNYVFKVNNKYDRHPADIPDVWKEIGGIRFHYTGYYTIGFFKMK